MPRKAIQKNGKQAEREIRPKPRVKGPKIGVFVCQCGSSIASVIDVDELTDYVRTLPNVVYAENLDYPCSQKGQDDIDQQTYFYNDVFHDLPWKPDAPGSKKLRATAKFQLVIKNISYGVFDLVVAHSTDTTTKSYAQGQFMTQIHWGEVKPLIAKDDLLGRNLFLYRKDSTPPEFMIEID